MSTTQTFVFESPNVDDSRLLKAFARHESFHPRYGWLKKGFEAVLQRPDVFTRPDATVALGVGKNMVRAIRYWCRAFKIVEEYPRSDRSRLLDARPTSFGTRLMGADGWDPYLERMGSLWLLHWMLMRPPCLAPAWSIIFNATGLDVFGENDLVRELKLYCSGEDDWADIAENSMRKDVDCLLHMYSFSSRRGSLEEGLNSPFVELRLVHPVAGDRGVFAFSRGRKDTLPDAVVVAACLDYIAWTRAQSSSGTISLRRLVHDVGAPGRVFKLTEAVLGDTIERYAESLTRLRLSETAGTTQLTYSDSPIRLMNDALAEYYSEAAVSGG